MSNEEAIADLGARMLVVEKAVEMLYADLYRDRPYHKAQRLADLKSEIAKATRDILGHPADDHAARFSANVMARESWDQASEL